MDWSKIELSETPIIIGCYSVGNVKYTKYKKRILVDGIKNVAVSNYRLVNDVIPSDVNVSAIVDIEYDIAQ